MKSEPIPNELLEDDIIVLKPTKLGWTAQYVRNVRAERESSIESGYPDSPKEKTKLTVWIDCTNSYPLTDIPCGTRIRYNGEEFDAVSVKTFSAGKPHHIKITAIKTKDVPEDEMIREG